MKNDEKNIKNLQINEKIINDKNLSNFEKTEQLLLNYENLKTLISDKKLEIDTIKRYGIPKSSELCDVHIDKYDYKNDYEKASAIINNLKYSIKSIDKLINKIDKILYDLRKDKYIGIIHLIYFNKNSRKRVAEWYNVDEKTIYRNKTRIISLISCELFDNVRRE